jgi:CRISPR system Cascade subunit CasA
MKGFQFPDNFQRYNKELMVPFQKSLKPREGSEPWFPVGFKEDKALWRDSLALFQSIEDKHRRPRIFDWLNDLAHDGAIGHGAILPVDFFGLAADKAKPLFWRHERFIVPLAYLDNATLLSRLGEALSLAEAVGLALKTSVKSLARYLLSPQVDTLNGRKPDEAKDVTPLAGSFGALSFYWSRLESPFKQLLVSLPQVRETNEESFNEAALQSWADTLIATAHSAFDQALNSLNDSGSNLKASAAAEKDFRKQLGGIRKETPHLFPTTESRGGEV